MRKSHLLRSFEIYGRHRNKLVVTEQVPRARSVAGIANVQIIMNQVITGLVGEPACAAGSAFRLAWAPTCRLRWRRPSLQRPSWSPRPRSFPRSR
jgi:hypothetical protein